MNSGFSIGTCQSCLNPPSDLKWETTMRKLLAIGFASLSLFLFGSTAFAHSGPGYSCRTAGNPAEIAVCQSSRLSRLDRALNYWYSRAKERARYFGQVKWLRQTQRSWNRSRNAWRRNRFCLRMKYRQRIRNLRNYTLHV